MTMIHDWNEYQRLAQRTSKDGHDRRKNGTIGLIGECGEVCDLIKKWLFQSVDGTPFPAKKIGEELGDILWYVAELLTGFDLKMEVADITEYSSYVEGDPYEMAVALFTAVGDTVEAARLGNPSKVAYCVKEMMYCVNDLARYCKINVHKIAADNIAKLRKRYPQGFDAEKSMKRYRNE